MVIFIAKEHIRMLSVIGKNVFERKHTQKCHTNKHAPSTQYTH